MYISKKNLGAPHLKYWESRKKKQENWGKIKCVFKFVPKGWLRVLFPENHVFRGENMFTDTKSTKRLHIWKVFVIYTPKPAFGCKLKSIFFI